MEGTPRIFLGRSLGTPFEHEDFAAQAEAAAALGGDGTWGSCSLLHVPSASDCGSTFHRLSYGLPGFY